MSDIGVVAIGRNEGERLRRCLDALTGLDATVVYVDSGSTDGSISLALDRGVGVIELDMTRPFTAARARNAGFERLLETNPGTQFVQFLDGDCELITGWPERGRQILIERPEVAVVFGRRREKHPERSIYNRLADLEWNPPIGSDRGDGTVSVLACGGDALIRVKALQAAGGYNPSIPAGEEPELCQRFRAAGWSIIAVDADMTRHDLEMFHFRQWAKRQVRTGYGGLDFVTRFGRAGDNLFRGQIQSARIWALGWPLGLFAVAGLAYWLGGPTAALLAMGTLALAGPAQALRITVRTRMRADSRRTAAAYGVLTMIGKFFQVAGHCLYLRDRLAGRHARLIEYKFSGLRAEQAVSSSRSLPEIP